MVWWYKCALGIIRKIFISFFFLPHFKFVIFQAQIILKYDQTVRIEVYLVYFVTLRASKTYLRQPLTPHLTPAHPTKFPSARSKEFPLLQFFFACGFVVSYVAFDLVIFFWHPGITKTYLYNSKPLKPHFYIVKLGFTGYILFSYFCSKT